MDPEMMYWDPSSSGEIDGSVCRLEGLALLSLIRQSSVGDHYLSERLQMTDRLVDVDGADTP